MAHIPYGYRIRDGRAEPVPDEAEKIRIFIDLYLSGLSIKEANQAAGIPRSATSLRHLLKNPVYLGDEYYPALTEKETFDLVALEIERRTHPGSRATARGQPVRQTFRMKPPRRNGSGMTAGEIASYIYSLIIPAADGRSVMSEKDTEKVRIWRNKLNHQ